MKIATKKPAETIETLIAREQNSPISDEMETTVSVREMVYRDEKKLRDFGFPDAVIGRAKTVAEMAEDESPEFVVVRTEEGESLSGRQYDGSILESIAEQVNAKEPVAYLGHIADNDLATAFPDPQTKWLGAIVKTEASKLKGRAGELVKVIYTAGYNLKDAKVRGYLKTGVVNSTSWQGRVKQIPLPGRGVKIVEFALDSLDWSRKGSEGMPTARVVALAREMKEGHKHMDGDKELAAVTPEEYKAENPNGYRLIVSEVKAESDATIREMETRVEESAAKVSLLDEIKKVLKVEQDADVLSQIATLLSSLGERAKATLKEALDKVMAEKVPDEDKRKLVLGLMEPQRVVMEQHVSKMPADGDVEAYVSEMVCKEFDENDLIQQVVSEMAPASLRRVEQLRGDGKLDTSKLGISRERRTL